MDRLPPEVDDSSIRERDARLLGEAFGPEEDAYQEARTVWNAMIDRYPALVARPTDTDDVVSAVEFARQHGLSVAVKGGGHNVAGNGVCDGGLLVDCSSMTEVQVDFENHTARVEPGVTIGDFDRATQAHGLATPGGIVSTTGLAGLTLGGGWGWLSRSYGLTIDNLRAVEVVTADGEVRHASEEENEDLFWGIRGGGGNFGVVTDFEFTLHEAGPMVLAGVLVYPFEVASDFLRFHREFTASAPEELCCYASVRTAPSASFVPEDLRGERIVTAYLCYSGAIEDGERAIRPLREFHEPTVDLVEARQYTEYQEFFDDVYPPGYRNYWKSQFVGQAGLSDRAIETLIDYMNSVTSPYTSIVIEHLGGAISRIDPDASAYPHRDAGYSFNIFTRWADADEDDEHTAWTQEFFAAMIPHLSDGVYVNFLSREDNERVQAAFGDNYDRLVELKRQYDPENLFRVNQNITPSA